MRDTAHTAGSSGQGEQAGLRAVPVDGVRGRVGYGVPAQGHAGVVVPVTVSPAGAGRAPASWPVRSSPQKRAVW